MIAFVLRLQYFSAWWEIFTTTETVTLITNGGQDVKFADFLILSKTLKHFSVLPGSYRSMFCLVDTTYLIFGQLSELKI